ncbi:MAG: hypothetical protein IJ001_07055 [Oscillospiraceae bacterium]|nr:hypothetical protein [Oscillospiraceae bacterium]
MKKTNQKYRHLTVHYYQPKPIYPNAADPSYFTEKALDILTAIVSGLGFATAMLFLITLA